MIQYRFFYFTSFKKLIFILKIHILLNQLNDFYLKKNNYFSESIYMSREFRKMRYYYNYRKYNINHKFL